MIPSEHAERVLVLAPSGRDGPLTCELLHRARLSATLCRTIDELLAAVHEGAGCALLSEEALTPRAIARLHASLNAQPPWSDFPIVVFGDRRSETSVDVLAPLGNVTFLDRPVQVRTMLAAVRAALRGRRRQYDAMRAIDSRDQFLAMFGHELRNPLAAITLSAELLRRKPNAEGAPRQLGVIERQSHNLARLVDDLLDVARVTYGKVLLRSETVDLAEVVHSSFAAHEPTAKRESLRYVSAIAPRLLVRGDRVRLEQIVGNLIGNAIKYTQPGGSVRVSAAAKDGEAVLRVEDTGVDIAPEMVDRVFDLFTQVDRSLDRAKGGMGLGLTVVKTLVQLHGGTVVARSAGEGRGSEFVVRLPLVAAAALDAPSALASVAPPCTVVIVEDSEDIRVVLGELLTGAGHVVTTAADGPQGVERILAVRPSIAFVDIGLPVFDGYEVARRVRSAGVPVRLVAVTGYGQADDIRRARDAGFDHHLKKPVGLLELEHAMTALC